MKCNFCFDQSLLIIFRTQFGWLKFVSVIETIYNEISNIEIAAQIALSFEIVHNEMLIMINVLISYVQLLCLIYISTRIFFYKWQMHITMFETWSFWRFLLGKKAKKIFLQK